MAKKFTDLTVDRKRVLLERLQAERGHLRHHLAEVAAWLAIVSDTADELCDLLTQEADR